jgi:hypothetical protein
LEDICPIFLPAPRNPPVGKNQKKRLPFASRLLKIGYMCESRGGGRQDRQTHPSEDEIERYCMGKLSEEAASQIEAHVYGCSECLVHMLETDDFLDAIRPALRRMKKTEDGL